MDQLMAAISMICDVARRRRVRTNKCDLNAHLSINYLTHSWYDNAEIYNVLAYSEIEFAFPVKVRVDRVASPCRRFLGVQL